MSSLRKKWLIFSLDILLVVLFLLMELIWFNKGISFSIFDSQVDINRAAYPLALLIICSVIRLYLSGFSLSKIKRSLHSFYQGKVLFICLALLLITLTIVSFCLNKTFSLTRGLEGRYFKTIDFKNIVFTRVDAEINFQYPILMEVADTDYSIQWKGYLYIPHANKYMFLLSSDDGSWLYLDNKLIIDNGGEHSLRRFVTTINLEKGFHPIKVSYFQKSGNSQLYLLWKPKDGLQRVLPEKNLFPEVPTSKELMKEKLASVLWNVTKILWIAGLIILARSIWKDKELKKKYSVAFLLFLILFISLLLRLYLLQYSLGFTDSDEAVEGLMAKHILQRGERPVLYYGLAYMGSLKSHITAIIYALFGVSVAGLKMATALFFFGFAFSLYYLAKQLFDEKVALVSTLIVALSPLYLTYKSLYATAAYMETLFLGTILLIIFNKLVFKRLKSGKENRLYCTAGFIAGLGFWLNPLIINYIIVGFIFILLKNHRFLITKGFLLILIFFFVGCFPLLLWNYNNSWLTISFLLGNGQISFLKKLANIPQNLFQIFTRSIPILLGVNQINGTHSLIGSFSWLILGIYAASFIFICYKREKGLSGILKLSLKESKGVDILIALPFVVIILYLNSEFADRALFPRYLIPIYSSLPIFAAVFLLWIKKYSHFLFIFLLIAILACNMYGNIYFYDQIKLENKRFKTFLSILEERNFNLAYSGFWQAYKITLATNEKVICSPKMYDPHLDRYPYYSELLRRSKKAVIIIGIGSKRGEALESRLREKDISFKRLDYYYSIYYSFSKRFWGGGLKKELRNKH
jgi:4-amino-4-deoxy-L-arabinose transferase-like glycosyltransferase